MRITHDGKVGIGTTDPNELLTVAGNVSAIKYYGDGSELTGLTATNNGIDVYFQTNTDYYAIPEHSGGVVHIDTSSGPLTAYFNEPLPEQFNVGIVVRANNPVTIKSTNSTILSQGEQLVFFLDKAFIYKEPISNYFIALGDLV
jgi:hypothetical protein